MQMTVEALIVALRGAADALEDYRANANVLGGDEMEVEALVAKKEPGKLFTEPAGEPTPQPQPEPDPEPPTPWETAPTETTPPQVEAVSAQDIVALYQQVAQAGKKVDMLKLLSGLGVEKVGELDDAGRAKLYARVKAEAGI